MKALLVLLCTFLATTIALPLRESSLDTIIAGTRFYLYTASNPEEPQEIRINDADSVKNSYFDKSRHTKIIIHGWTGSYLTKPNEEVRHAYLTQEDYNIISVDWSTDAALNYISSRAKVPVVGEDIADLLDFLNEQFNLSYDKVVLVGHSLGAHVAGYCGKIVKHGKIAGIVGLDPAFPLYNYNDPSTRLSTDDAKFVLSIQTNGSFKGFPQPIGSAAFYPNWGLKQPGCGADLSGTCSHGRSITLYAEALRGYVFTPLYECSSYDDITAKAGCDTIRRDVQVGDPLQIIQKAGIYYFTTNDESPFGILGDRSLQK
ncbi:pancreatic lipase-related protein 2 isoform X2 [Bactrocera dorsalis]|uniref:Pancreatic lipase-related protein 2 isoform X2 n=1 Tax=Bactrocera dorsalis TaxID=27457 RepID=A0A6I9VJB9_BACDO|nr:pancreatic lipase-related protein 2 isoform X2 [Bactrocera dorsalis]